jgi:DNA-binding NarL/FixJ family response regulator
MILKNSTLMAERLKPKRDVQTSQIFLVEDHPIFRDGLLRLLNAEDDLHVCGEAGDAKEALRSITKLKPDLVIVDIGLPGKSGLELIKEIRALKFATKLLAVSMFDEAVYAQRVLRAGGDGYVMKQEDPETIVLAVRDVLAGRIYISEEVFGQGPSKQTVKKTSPIDQLTDSELEILELLGLGKSVKEISLQIGLSGKEANTHSKSIRRKLKLKSGNALIRYAVGWVEDNSK